MYGKWLGLSLETRNKIAQLFGIIKKGATEVFSNEIKNDGYLVQDIEAALTIEAMQKYLGSEHTDRDLLASMLVSKIETQSVITATPIPEPVIATGTFEKIEVMSEVKPKKVKVVKKAVTKIVKVIKKVAKKNAKKK